MKIASIATTKPKVKTKSVATTRGRKSGFRKMKGIYKDLIEETEDCWNLGK